MKNSRSEAYAAAGVDITAGYRAVELMKKHISRTETPGVCSDVGGFGSDCTPELLCRWTQLGCFTPLFRNHAAKGTRHQEPWAFDRQTLDICRKYIRLRYRLIPYIYDCFHETESTGLPVFRPLCLE
ncbi:MAG: hypothetical protein IIY95_01340, partial [Firmicutes bacterium]|nr:hypothetical protein [Bacillota bacterium]